MAFMTRCLTISPMMYSRVVSEFLNSAASSAKPRHLWSQHTLPVTDVHVGYGGTRARVASASLDHTCKVSSYVSGILLRISL